jgi:hypothetical protein
MKKKFILSLMVVLLVTFSSCASLIIAVAEEGKHFSKLKNEASITGGNGVNWRSELAYNESKSKDLDSTGLWYLAGIRMHIQNLSADSQYNGISILHFVQNDSYQCELALVATDDKPAGEESSFTVKKLGEPGNTTWKIKYVLSTDGNSFNITDLGGLNSPPLMRGPYSKNSPRSR